MLSTICAISRWVTRWGICDQHNSGYRIVHTKSYQRWHIFQKWRSRRVLDAVSESEWIVYCVAQMEDFTILADILRSLTVAICCNLLLHLWTQFLCLKYFLAKVHTQQNNLLERKTFLELARTHFKDYLEQCAALRIIEDDVLGAENDEVSFTQLSILLLLLQ